MGIYYNKIPNISQGTNANPSEEKPMLQNEKPESYPQKMRYLPHFSTRHLHEIYIGKS